MRVFVHAQAAKGEGDATGHGVGLKRRLIDCIGPVRLRNRQPFGAPSILHGGIERDVCAHGSIVFLNRFKRALCVDIFELANELLECVSFYFRYLTDAVLVTK